MGNKKQIIIAAVLAMLCTGVNPAGADVSSLVQMDVKKSSVSDSVDVTLYTTGQNSNSVVTRKSNNRYVLLLPNISSSSSAAPNLGGVKDLITDVEVKHVNDGIGGYTKITFSTTKPINIKTYTKHANPVTAAQKDYKNIIAQNNTKPAASTIPASKPAANTQTKQSEKPVSNVIKQPQASKVSAKPQAQQAKSDTKTTQNIKVKPVEMIKNTAKKVQQTTKPEPKHENITPVVPTPPAEYEPKMKFDENGKRIIDLEPRVSHTSQNTVSDNVINEENQALTNQDLPQETTAVDESQSPDNSKTSSLWKILIAGGGITLLLAAGAANIFASSNARRRRDLETCFSVSSIDKFKKPKDKYSDISQNSNLNWQEKYKLLQEKETENNPPKQTNDLSYVTNLGATKKALITESAADSVEEIDISEKPISGILSKSLRTSMKHTNSKQEKIEAREIFKQQMQAKISQMEHAYSKTSGMTTVPQEISNNVKSEDDAIVSKLSEVKLKSFAKRKTLRETRRNAISLGSKSAENTGLQEGKFVNLTNSALSVAKRSSNISGWGRAEVSGSQIMNLRNNGEMKMTKENESYLLSSLDEYLTILDNEKVENRNSSIGRSGVTNPISRSRSSVLSDNMIVKSGYSISSDQGFYLVNMDGVSALIGKVKDSTYILKKFDRIIDEQLQVRRDDNDVYIVRAGRFKCLVDVSKGKMGTLVEI